MRWFFALFPLCLFAQATMLSRSEELSHQYSALFAKAPPPSPFPRTEKCLEAASVWFSLDLSQFAVPSGKTAFDVLRDDALWRSLREIGIEGVYLEHLRNEESLSLNPIWGNDWVKVVNALQKRNLVLLGEGVKNSVAWGSDFELALCNVGEYPTLFHLIEIDSRDWKWLPPLPAGQKVANVPWLALQELQRRGYIPEASSPYTKISAWNATGKIECADGKVRRWIYLSAREGEIHPSFAWLAPSFGANRIAAAGALESLYCLGQKILFLDGELPHFAKEGLALWIRKLGGFSAERGTGSLFELQRSCADLSCDTLTRAALLHALIAEDAEALRLIYRLFLEEGIEGNALVHILQPFDEFTCDWAELLAHPRKKYTYCQENVTGELLRQRLLKGDLQRLGMRVEGRIPPSTWTDYCAAALGIKELDKHREEIQKAHLLLAFTYAMQPGVFSLSAADLLGALPHQADHLDLLGTNPTTLYESLPLQMQNSRSFATRLKEILAARKENEIGKGTITAVPNAKNRGCLLLVQRLKKEPMTALLAVNFSRNLVRETLELPSIRQTTAIDLMTGLAEEKIFESPQFSFALSPLSGKLFLFQGKYYE